MRESSPYEANELTVGQLQSATRQRWWLPILGLILGLGFGLVFSLTQEPKYESVTTALVHATSADDSASDRLAAEELAKSRAVTYEALGGSVVVADTVKQNLGLETPADELLDNVRVVARPDTTGLEITATAASPQEAAELAGAWREALAEAGGDPQPGEQVEVVPAGEPTVPDDTAGISTSMALAIGGAVGLLLGIIAAVSLGHPKYARGAKPVKSRKQKQAPQAQATQPASPAQPADPAPATMQTTASGPAPGSTTTPPASAGSSTPSTESEPVEPVEPTEPAESVEPPQSAQAAESTGPDQSTPPS